MEQKQSEVVRYDSRAVAANQATLKGFINQPHIKTALADVAADRLSPDRVIKMVLMASARQPELLNCTMESILTAAMTSADLALDCSGILGRAYLVAYGKQATFIIGYQGEIELAFRSDKMESIQVEVVYRQDFFKYEKGLKNTLEHIPNEDHEELDEDIIGAYTIAKFRPSGYHIQWMTRKKILKIRDEFAKTRKIWDSHFPDMCKKTVVHKASKFWPLSTESQMALAAAYAGEYEEGPIQPTKPALQPTKGRQPWGLAPEKDKPEDSGSKEPPPPDDSSEEDQAETGATPSGPTITDKQAKQLEKDFYARCKVNKISTTSQAATHLLTKLFEKAEVKNWGEMAGFVSVEAYDKLAAWMDENLPMPEE